MFTTLACLALVGAAVAVPSKTENKPTRLIARSSNVAVACTPTQTADIVCWPDQDIASFDQTVQDDTEGDLYLAWQPYLYVIDGCVPFPAVNAAGDTSAGLTPDGSPDGDCSSSTGQIYSRSAEYNGTWAIVYTWYFPKDEPSEAEATVGIGHRYDWEGTVVFLESEAVDAALVGVSASFHGSFVSQVEPALYEGHPLISYYSYDFVLDHSCGFTETVGGMQPLISWDELPTAAQTALTEKDWGSANVPIIDANFEAYIEDAYAILAEQL